MIVVDASCLAEIVIRGVSASEISARLMHESDMAAPHVVDAEVLGVIRRERLLERLDATAADLAVDDLATWPGERLGHQPLLRRAWELRGTVRSWDALYVALAEGLDAPLLTLDARLAAAPGTRCQIELVAG